MEIHYYRRLKNVDRLGTSTKLRSYNLMEHCYMVGMLFRHFASKEDVAYDINVLDIVLHHDILEVITGDLPYTVKNLNGNTTLHWEAIEEHVANVHHQLRRYTDRQIKEAMTPRQYALFKACDLLDLWIFLKEEEALGNHSKDCSSIIITCERLVQGQFPKIDQYMKNYKF